MLSKRGGCGFVLTPTSLHRQSLAHARLLRLPYDGVPSARTLTDVEHTGHLWLDAQYLFDDFFPCVSSLQGAGMDSDFCCVTPAKRTWGPHVMTHGSQTLFVGRPHSLAWMGLLHEDSVRQDR